MKLLRRLRLLFLRGKLDAEMREEMRQHIEEQTRRNIESGMDTTEAHYAAERTFGNVSSIQERAREARHIRFIDDFKRDARVAVRMLRKSPGFTAVAVLSLALGIGANTAIFNALQAVLLQQPPYAQPTRLVSLVETRDGSSTGGKISPSDFLYFQRSNSVFSRMSACNGAQADGSAMEGSEAFLTGEGSPVRLKCLGVLPGLFEVLGVSPVLGRSFSADELYDSSIVMLTYGCWQTQFGGDPQIVGRSIVLGGRARTVIGVMPQGFFFPSKDFQVFWTPGMAPGTFAPDHDPFLSVIARLRDGVSIQQAGSQLGALASRLQTVDATEPRRIGVRLDNFHASVAATSRPALLMLLLAVEVFFLIICSNLANLLLSRAASRRQEFAIRGALGASRGQIVRQLLTEGLLLSLAGGLLGFALVAAANAALVHFIPGLLPPFSEIRTGSTAITVGVVASLMTPLLFALFPAWSASRSDRLHLEGNATSRRAGPMRNLLITFEVALAAVLLVGAGLLLNSFVRLESTDPGFRTEHTVTFRLVSSGREGGIRGGSLTFADIESRLRAIPGVRDVGGTWSLPLRPLQDPALEATIEGREGEVAVLRGGVTPDYFKAMGTPLIRGRFFDDQDTSTSLRIAIVNEAFGNAYFHGENPVGKRLKMGPLSNANVPWLTIVGVVGDQRRTGIDQPVPPAVWAPVTQITPPTLSFVLRATVDPGTLVASARRVIGEGYKDVSLMDVATLDDLVQESVRAPRFRTSLLTALAAIALLLSAIGVYGVLAFSVVQRTPEIGIRMALGAQRIEVLWLVMRQGLKPVTVGLAMGLIGSLALGRLARSWLYGIAPADPATYACVALLLATVAVLACWLPARRAARVDPVIALRAE